MRKIIVPIMITLLFLTGCPNPPSPEQLKPPQATVRVDNKQITTRQGSFCWSEGGAGVCQDAIPPDEIAKKLKPTTVKPKSRLTIQFHRPPKKGSLGVNLWKDHKPQTVQVVNNVIGLPDRPGVYVYDFFAEWEQGSASYVFVVEVK
ncbi:hypothetical protein [Thermoflavimicrobium daqui]|uniref:Lipoprotein n=1 Tax=Thermoflavimicrobium daqui TaxID=2137476 RepID=A0A364K0I5_9BACL|nr:hypothetical protein [Thermoflavimicrobium daqui]RAL20850.1 hypothetical protein DL897_17610 [Thermoflavimicrobium daqui]